MDKAFKYPRTNNAQKILLCTTRQIRRHRTKWAVFYERWTRELNVAISQNRTSTHIRGGENSSPDKHQQAPDSRRTEQISRGRRNQFFVVWRMQDERFHLTKDYCLLRMVINHLMFKNYSTEKIAHAIIS